MIKNLFGTPPEEGLQLWLPQAMLDEQSRGALQIWGFLKMHKNAGSPNHRFQWSNDLDDLGVYTILANPHLLGYESNKNQTKINVINPIRNHLQNHQKWVVTHHPFSWQIYHDISNWVFHIGYPCHNRSTSCSIKTSDPVGDLWSKNAGR